MCDCTGHMPMKLALVGGHLAHALEKTKEAEEGQEVPGDSDQALMTSSCEPGGPAVPGSKTHMDFPGPEPVRPLFAQASFS